MKFRVTLIQVIAEGSGQKPNYEMEWVFASSWEKAADAAQAAADYFGRQHARTYRIENITAAS